MITIVVDGEEYGGFLRASATMRLDALSNTFSFGATSRDRAPLPFRGGEACRVLVDGEAVLTGYIELINVTAGAVSNGSASYSIEISGRDKTGDLLDSTIGSLNLVQGSAVTLKRLCELVIKHIGADIEVVDEANPKPFENLEDAEDPELGTSAFKWLEKYARKRQVLLTSDGEGRLVIARGTGEQVDAFVQNQKGDPNQANNVLEFSASYDQTGRYNVYLIASQLSMVSLASGGGASASAVAEQSGIATDEAIRTGRQLALISEVMSSSSSASVRAEWEKKVRAARGSVYSPRVLGHRDQQGNLWRINTLPRVRDDGAGISGRMLLNSATFDYDLERGSTTLLAFVREDAYSLELQEPNEEEEPGSGLHG